MRDKQNMRAGFFILLCLLGFSAPCWAENTTQELLEYCEEGATSFKAGMCLGYISGAVSMEARSVGGQQMALILSGKPLPSPLPSLSREYCAPGGVTLGQIQAIFIKFARENPANWHFPASGMLMSSLAKEFPCPTSAPSR